MAARPRKSTSVAASSRSPVTRASHFRGSCLPPARRRCGWAWPAPVLPASLPSPAAAVAVSCWRWPRRRERGAVVGGGLRGLEAAYGLARAGERVAVVGGGLLGLEAAYGLARAGAPVT